MPDPSQIFLFFFLMLGPVKIIAPFARVTAAADASLTRQIALRAMLYASICLLLAGILGGKMLTNFGIPVSILSLAGGIILFLVALNNVLQQFAPPEPREASAGVPSLNVAMSPIAFPTIVTPYGIAAVIVFLAISPDLRGQLIVGAIVLLIMLLNLVIMLAARRIIRYLVVILPILGAILGVVQVALGLKIMITQLKILFA